MSAKSLPMQKLNKMSIFLKFRKFSTTATTTAAVSANKKVSIIADLASLSKFRLTSLVSFTTAAGFLSIGLPMDFLTLISACIGTSLCAGSASTFNQVFEKSQDMNMKRTSARPLPSGRISLSTAVSFGVSTGAAGTMLLYVGTNPVVAALGAGNIILYSVFYTFSKRYTEYNTWIGSIVGAIPPVMGYAAASGGTVIAPESIILASILFLWQFPHFFALSWMHRQDYARGGFSMVPVNDPSGLRTAALIQEYSLYLAALPIITCLCDLTSFMFAIEGTAANIYLLSLVYKFKKDRSNANARKIFLCSLWYLPLLLIGFVFHTKTIENNQTDDLKPDVALILDSPLDQPLQHEQTKKPENIFEKIKNEIKNIFKQICIHEVIVYRNKNKSNTAVTDDSVDTNILSTDKAGDSVKEDSHMCMKIKSDQAIHSIKETAAMKTRDLSVLISAEQAAAAVADSGSSKQDMGANNGTLPFKNQNNSENGSDKST